ncbi:MAG TPA: DUF4097 family beta strand repeat-containing protein [Solirubrobacteraceae bacterium]|nr:DUF4097 family beta strand repeat-containing protein [Solirubrobacteraceae bacterium]
MRTFLHIVVAIVVVGLVLVGAFGILDVAARHSFAVRAAYADVRSLNIDSGSGNVTVTGDPGARAVTVTAHVTEGLFRPGREASLRGGVLRVTASCRGFTPNCSVSYDVTVPAGIEVVASSGAGDVRALRLDSGASLVLSSGAGDISATDVRAGTIKLSSGAGNISAELGTPAQSLTASSGVGDINLEVPGTVAYSVDATSGVGHVSDSQISTQPNAPRRIHASSGTGDVSITPVR